MEDLVSARRRSRQAGMTIVEVLIALILASIVAIGVISFFTGQRTIYDSHSHIAEAELNGQTALEMIARVVRDSGMGFVECSAWCGSTTVSNNGTSTTVAFGPGVITPVVLGSSAAPPDVGLRVGTGNVLSRLPPLWVRNSTSTTASDTLYVAYGVGGTGAFVDAPLTSTVATVSDPVMVPAATIPAFQANDYILLIDTTVGPGGSTGCVPDHGCTLFQITSISGNTLVHAANFINPGSNVTGLIPQIPYPPPQMPTQGYVATYQPAPGVRNIGQLKVLVFDIPSEAGPPTLRMTSLESSGWVTTPLAVGIEDLQIAVGCDINGNGIIDEGTDATARKTDEWYVNTASDSAIACPRPEAVRITVAARSVEPDSVLMEVTSNMRPAIEDRIAGTPDQFRHRIYQTVVYPRNSR